MPEPFPNLPHRDRGTLHVIEVSSRVLADNPLLDPSTRDLHVWVPRGEGPFPAVFVLPGFAGTGEGLLARGLSEMSLASRLDRLALGGCAPFIAVLPDCMSRLGGTQYVDSPMIGQYATYLLELKEYVDRGFQTTGRWGVVGKSSGGFGALHLAMSFPGSFQAVASISGDLGFDLCYLGDLLPGVRGLLASGDLDGFVHCFWEKERPGHHDFAAFNLVAMSCAYADQVRPLEQLLPVDLRTGELRPDVLARWARFDPVQRVAESAEALRALDLLHVECGDADEYLLDLGARRFAAACAEHAVPVVHQTFKGSHRGTSGRYDEVLPRVAAALGR